jgi:hypothetical protein
MLLAIIIWIYGFGWFVATVCFCVNEDLEGRVIDSGSVAVCAVVSLFWPLVVVYLAMADLPFLIITGLSSFTANRIRAFKRYKVKLTKD